MNALIAIPVYNEQKYLPNVLDAVRRYAANILVIDDGSTDATPKLLRDASFVSVITHPENRGYGQSVIDAFKYAAFHGYDWVVTMDCDEQHEPERIPDFLAAAARDDADVISGSRYLVNFPGDDAPPVERAAINRRVNVLLAELLELRVTDSFCGFKAHRVSAMQQLRLDEPGYAFPMQFWVECVRAGLRIHELPVRRIYRDRNRQFGGTLDDPAARMEHYLNVFVRALQRPADANARAERNGCTKCCRG